MTDEQLVDLAEKAKHCRLDHPCSLPGLAQLLSDVDDVLYDVPALAEELREARRRLAERGEARPEW